MTTVEEVEAATSELRSAGWSMPQGDERIRDGDNAIRFNAYRAHQDIQNARWAQGAVEQLNVSDLNNLLKPGVYSISTAAASSIQNAPARMGAGSIEVFLNGAGGLSQRIHLNNGFNQPRILHRSGATTGTGFGPWVPLTQLPEPIISDAPLSTYTTPGVYSTDSTQAASLPPDVPADIKGIPFTLNVETTWRSTSAFWCVQVLTTLPLAVGLPPRTFKRNLTQDGIVSDWREDTFISRDSHEFPTGARRALLRAASKKRHGGKIGTNGATPVALSFDHGFVAFRDKVLPHLIRLGLPATVAVNTDTLGSGESAGVSYPELQTWAITHGIEIAHHSRSHSDVSFARSNLTALQNQILGPIKLIKENCPNIIADSYIMPGVSGTQYQGFNGGAVYEDWWQHPAGRMILDNFAAVSSLTPGELVPCVGEPADTMQRVGMDSISWANKATSLIQAAYGTGMGIHVYLHPALLDTTSRTTTTRLIQFLEFLASQRNQGNVEVLTMGGFAWADTTSQHRYDLLQGTSGPARSVEIAPRIAWAQGAQVRLYGLAQGTVQVSDSTGLLQVQHDATGTFSVCFTVPYGAVSLSFQLPDGAIVKCECV